MTSYLRKPIPNMETLSTLLKYGWTLRKTSTSISLKAVGLEAHRFLGHECVLRQPSPFRMAQAVGSQGMGCF